MYLWSKTILLLLHQSVDDVDDVSIAAKDDVIGTHVDGSKARREY